MSKEDEREDLTEALNQQKVLCVSALFIEYAKDPEKFKEEVAAFFVDIDSSEGKMALLLRNIGVIEMSLIANKLVGRDFQDLVDALDELTEFEAEEEEPLEGEEKVLAYITILNSMSSPD